MEECNKAIIEKLCMTVCQDGDGGPLNITRDEALGLLNSLLAKQCLEEQVKRVEISRQSPRIVHHLRFRRYFEVFGHNGMIDRLCFDNSSTYAFSGSVDGIIKIWDIRRGMLIRSLYGHCSSINDLCVSITGEYLVSADYQGMICVWCLRTFVLLHSFDMQSEVIFCEFFVESGKDRAAGEGKPGACGGEAGKNKESVSTFTCILANGVVKTVKFCRASVISVRENIFMQGENIKAICITDGGRFIICGGWWPFILIYDTHNLENVMILEDFKAQTLCACRNGLKIAASAANKVCLYTFYVEGGLQFGNFKKRRNIPGCWRKATHLIGSGETVERMCFLSSFLLVTASTDGLLRVYDDEHLVLAELGEVGCLYAHPFRNIFAVVGQQLCIYEIIEGPCDTSLQPPYLRSACFGGSCVNNQSLDHVCISNRYYDRICTNDTPANTSGMSAAKPFLNKFFSEPLQISINDCQFSNDGRFFITSDDRGAIKVYSIDQPINAPVQQFFTTDFSAISANAADDTDVGGAANDENTANGDSGGGNDARFNYTVDAERNINKRWKKYDYPISQGTLSPSVQIEALAAKYLEKERMDFGKFSARYLVREEPEEAEENSSGDKTWTSMEDSYSSTEETSFTTEDEDTYSHRDTSNSVGICSSDKEERVVSLRRNRRILVSDSESGDAKVTLRRNRRMLVSDSESDGRRVRLRRKTMYDDSPEISDGQDEVIKLRRGHRILRRSISGGGNTFAGDGKATESSSSAEGRDDSSSGVILRNSRKLAREPKEADRERSEDQPVHRRQLRKDKRVLVDSDEGLESACDPSIDPQLEAVLSGYSKSWLLAFSVHVDDLVFFDSDAYRVFLSLEGRLGVHSIPETGVYSVAASKILFVGTIPYLSLRLAGCATVCFYEYPEGKGIVCHEAQREMSGAVDLIVGDAAVSGRIVEADGLAVRTSAGWLLRAFIAVRGPALGLPPIPYSHAHRILFGRVRGGLGRVLDIINYDTVNKRLSLCMYRSPEQLLSDLRTVSQAAAVLGPPHSEYAQFIYESYK